MASLNSVELIGNLGRDPEVRRMTSGDPVVTLSIATSETWRDKQSGEKRENTEWHRVVIFNKNLAEVAEKYLRKGSTVFLRGSLKTRKWTDKDGIERYTTEVVLSGFNCQLIMVGGTSGRRDDAGAPATDQQHGTSTQTGAGRDDLDDEIPF